MHQQFIPASQDINFVNCIDLNEVKPLVSAILAQTIPNSNVGASHAGNWPPSAQFGVDYKVHDSQFPQVKHERDTDYFDCSQDLLRWLESKREWIKGTDYDFSMQYSVYEWDLGPNLKYSQQM